MFHYTRVKERGLNVSYIGISLLKLVGKIYAGILVDRVHRNTGSLIDDKQENLRYLLDIRRMDSPECTDKGVMWSEEGSR